MSDDDGLSPPTEVERIALPDAGDPEEQIRRKHLFHEAAIRSVGVLYTLSAFPLALFGIISVTAIGEDDGIMIVAATLALLTSAGFFALGLFIFRLDARAKLPIGILAAIGSLGFPIGTLIYGYVLYLFFSEKGRVVLTEHYRSVVARTPHITYMRTLAVIVTAVLLVLGVMVVAIAMFWPGPSR